MSRETNFSSIVSPQESKEAFGGFVAPSGKVAEAYLDRSAAELTRLAYTREVLNHAFERKTLSLVTGDEVGIGGRAKTRLYVKIDPPIRHEEAAAWAGLQKSTKEVSAASFFSLDNSKMQCPSFAIPAGAPEIGGTCIAASAAQIVGKTFGKSVQEFDAQGRKRLLPVIPEKTICSACYAVGGASFQHSSTQIGEMARYLLLKDLSRKEMAEVIDASLHAEKASHWPVENGHRFFRIHDSGDFFDPSYALAWFDAAWNHQDVVFWAPTRTHVNETWRKFWAQSAGDRPENLIVRPSSYHFDEAAPYVPGLNPGSTSLYERPKTPAELAKDSKHKYTAQVDPKRAQWNCRVYFEKGKDAKSCTEAIRPDKTGGVSSEKGCRACWLTDLTINYTAHR